MKLRAISKSNAFLFDKGSEENDDLSDQQSRVVTVVARPTLTLRDLYFSIFVIVFLPQASLARPLLSSFYVDHEIDRSTG